MEMIWLLAHPVNIKIMVQFYAIQPTSGKGLNFAANRSCGMDHVLYSALISGYNVLYR